MDIKNDQQNKLTDISQPSEQPNNTSLNPTNTKEPNQEKSAKRVRRQATEAQLNHPLHGVKLKQLLERLVAHYGWAYLGDRTNINCFIYNPTMKSSLGFLRRTAWAREHVEDLYMDMAEEQKQTQNKS
ncbi:VF530 family protein [Olleya namhaensis]|uniref:VF530 family protein n=1 Tax=Olleya namhaensis TaxID=1144750 RepID=UPI002FE4B6EF